MVAPAGNRKTKILLDGSDPEETQKIGLLIGGLDGQTISPSLVAKNPQVRRKVIAGRKLSLEEHRAEYKKIVQKLSPLVGDAGVFIGVSATLRTTCEELLAQGREMFSWIPNASIAYPCTYEGLRAARISVEEGIRVNVTFCFSQEQAAGAYAATQTAESRAYLSPFIGRLSDSGANSADLLSNIQRMYREGDGHVSILAANIRSVDQLLTCLAFKVEMVTAPRRVLEEWALEGMLMPDRPLFRPGLGSDGRAPRPISYRQFNLNKPWNAFNLRHELTRKGIEKFVADSERALRRSDRTSRQDEPRILLPQ